VTAPVLADALLDARTARRLVGEARNALALADDLLARLYAGRAWEVLGHKDWPALCAAELPELRHLKMRTPARRERVAALLEHGATIRDIAAATGASVGTAHGDVATITAATTGDGLRATDARTSLGVAPVVVPAHRARRRAGRRGRVRGAHDPAGAAPDGLDLRGDVGGAVPGRAPRAGRATRRRRAARRVPSLRREGCARCDPLL
jgi:hypothetical protein